jgi:membrane associated rhomboid family serine protease
MFGVTTSDDDQPVTWVGSYPVHVTTLLVAIHSIAAVLACFMTFAGGGILNALMFDSAAALNGAVWQLVTYAFVHPPSRLLWFAIEMYMLFMFGREVERFLGRKAFITLYSLLLIGPTLLLSAWGFWERTGIAGSSGLHFGIFVAFATIYPRVEMFLRIMVKWIALGFGAILTLQLFRRACVVGARGALVEHRWLRSCLCACAASVASSSGGAASREVQPKPKFKVVPRAAPRRVVAEAGRRACLDRSAPREDLEVGHQQPHGE